jgi:hypothetical protein
MQTPLLLMPVSLPLGSVINIGDKTVNQVAVSAVRDRIAKAGGIEGISVENSVLADGHWKSLLKKILEIT